MGQKETPKTTTPTGRSVQCSAGAEIPRYHIASWPPPLNIAVTDPQTWPFQTGENRVGLAVSLC